MDLVRRPRERAHGPSGGGRGGGDRDPRREVGRAAARGRRPPRGRVSHGGRSPRVPRPAVREVVAPGPLRVRGRDPEDRGREVPEDRAPRAVRGAIRRAAGRGEVTMAELVKTELDGAVALVTIDHPPVNALSAPLLEELEAELVRLDED